ncbi:tail fiber assembly protein [Variovorax ureilyticus]|uniref:tail fiber assembly protein n=1 Tax=Variovorax ureilyticus TaxID=1836198 RepID=UPI003D667364
MKANRGWALCLNGKLQEVIAPAYYAEDVFGAPSVDSEESVVLHHKGEEIAIADRFHPEFVAQLIEIDLDNPPPDDPVPGPSVEELASNVRAQRDRLLVMSDWTQLPDVPEVTRQAWLSYRQGLRDVPGQEGFPSTIDWPKAPS